jgi:uncharacterized protein (DUF58 family)
MVGTFIPLLVLLLIFAALMRDDFAITLIYLFVGAYAIGTWWSHRSLAHISFKRQFAAWAFLGEKIDIGIQINNKGWLPVLWINIQESLPVALSSFPSYEHVTTLGPRAEARYNYTLEARKRGYYPIGPLFVSTGDILGLSGTIRLQGQVQYLTVYPKIVPLTSINIPSRSPQGTLRHTQPIFEDPTRVFGKRDYITGDSLRRVDWKSSATTGRLQVKLFEPSIALETLIFLNLNAEDYQIRTRIDSTELAIVIAASVAAWVAGKQQTVGLKVNGRDPLMGDSLPQYIPPRKGQAHLMRILENLARVEMTSGTSLSEMIQQQRYHLSWGTTLLVITGLAGDDLLDELYQARRAGQNAVLILAGPSASFREISHRAGHFGIPVVSIPNERSLDIWRK